MQLSEADKEKAARAIAIARDYAAVVIRTAAIPNVSAAGPSRQHSRFVVDVTRTYLAKN